MTLASGTRLGPYEVVAPLGAGGMGEVYRARDTRLGRDVAIKVLPSEVAADPERRARFEREARAVAALDHPHICAIYDVGEANGTHYLVMPLLDGQTLEARLAKGALPLDQALAIAGQIADALDKAHRQGIVHRDLKPANVMLTKAGAGAGGAPQAKLLDFGLAKLRAPGGPVTLSATGTAATAATATAEGTILGTLHYMAPEQVEGKEADARSDIWALGAVLYEMVTGGRPFQGDTAASVIGSILKDAQQPLSSRQPVVPSALDHVVEVCLAKAPDDRWQTAGDVRREVRWIAGHLASETSRPAASAGNPSSSSRARRAGISAALAGLAALAAAGVGVLTSRALGRADGNGSVEGVKFELLPPPHAQLAPAPTAATAQVALSADGTRLAFVAARTGEPPRIWVRALDRLDAHEVAGTDNAAFPFWSPNGRFVAFFADSKLKKVDVEQGAPQTLADVAAGRGGTWSPSGVIVFGRSSSPLSQVPEDGGPVTAATAFDPAHDAAFHYWPQFLPDGRHFLFLQRSLKAEYQGIYVGSLDSPQVTRVLASSVRGLFASGRLLFIRDGLLFYQALDDTSLQLTGEPVRLAEGVGYYASSFGYAAFDVSTNGVLAFGPTLQPVKAVETLDRTGTLLSRSAVEGVFFSARLGDDEKTLLVTAREEGASSDIWAIDLARNNRSRVTSHSDVDWFPMWMPNGRDILFATTRLTSSAGANTIFSVNAGGTGKEAPLNARSPLRGYPADVSKDGRVLLFYNLTRQGYDIGSVSLVPGDAPIDFVATPYNEAQPRFSPDNRWVAYSSDESGRFEVYIRAWPTGTDRVTVSVDGGMQPEWRRDGQELFYLAADRRIMAVSIAYRDGALTTGLPRPLFAVNVPAPVSPYPNDYAVTRDGQRFIVTANAKVQAAETLKVFYHWANSQAK